MLFVCVTQISLPTARHRNTEIPEPSPSRQSSASNYRSEELTNAGSTQSVSGAEGRSPADQISFGKAQSEGYS